MEKRVDREGFGPSGRPEDWVSRSKGERRRRTNERTSERTNGALPVWLSPITTDCLSAPIAYGVSVPVGDSCGLTPPADQSGVEGDQLPLKGPMQVKKISLTSIIVSCLVRRLPIRLTVTASPITLSSDG